MQIQNIPIEQITCGKRIRPLKADAVTELAKSIEQIGLLNPIAVREDNQLIAGRHRLEAVKSLGWSTVPANVCSVNELQSRLAEIDENLIRNDLTALEHAEHLAERKQVYEGIHPETKREATLKQHRLAESAKRTAPSFVADTAAKTGASERTVRTDVQIGTAIDEPVRDMIRDTDIADKKTELLKLAQMPKEQQKSVAEKIVSGEAKTVKDAIKPHVSNNSGNNEWYTPAEYITAARKTMGSIDLDPASSVVANKIVKAKQFFTLEDDGLQQEWRGSVWMNPPYASDLVGKFASKLCRHFLADEVDEAVVLVNNATETKWFQEMAEVASAICFPRSRIKFLDANGVPANTPLQGQAVIYMGQDASMFKQCFSDFGFIVCR